MEDTDLAGQTFDRILKHYADNVDPRRMTVPHRTVLAVFHSHGILCNGGFQYLFEGNLTGDPHFQITRESHRTIGALNALAAFDKAYAVFANSNPPSDMDERLAIWQSNYNLVDAITDPSTPDAMYLATMDDVMTKLTEYIQSHPEDFADLGK